MAKPVRCATRNGPAHGPLKDNSPLVFLFEFLMRIENTTIPGNGASRGPGLTITHQLPDSEDVAQRIFKTDSFTMLRMSSVVSRVSRAMTSYSLYSPNNQRFI
jgi:hypothetical protein